MLDANASVGQAHSRLSWGMLLSSLMVFLLTASSFESIESTGARLAHEEDPVIPAAAPPQAMDSQLSKPSMAVARIQNTPPQKPVKPSAKVPSGEVPQSPAATGSTIDNSSETYSIQGQKTVQRPRPTEVKINRTISRPALKIPFSPIKVTRPFLDSSTYQVPLRSLPQALLSPKMEVFAGLGTGAYYNIHNRSNNLEVSPYGEVSVSIIKNKRWVIGTGLGFSKRRYEIEDSPAYVGNPIAVEEFDQVETRTDVVSIPLSLGYKVKLKKNSKIAFIAVTGAKGSFVTSSKATFLYRVWTPTSQEGTSGDFANTGMFTEIHRNRHNPNMFLSVFVGIDGSVEISDKCSLSMSLRYEDSMYQGNSPFDILPNHISMGTGISYKL